MRDTAAQTQNFAGLDEHFSCICVSALIAGPAASVQHADARHQRDLHLIQRRLLGVARVDRHVTRPMVSCASGSVCPIL